MSAVEAHDELAIEPMVSGHVRAVVTIEERTFDSPWTEAMFRQEVADGYLSRSWVATLGGRVIGYLISWFLREEVHLLNIAVDPDFRGRGYGRQMMRHLVHEAVHGGREMITLEVRESNAPARRMYESFGFVNVGRRLGYYQDNREDAVVMNLYLHDSSAPDGAPGDA